MAENLARSPGRVDLAAFRTPTSSLGVGAEGQGWLLGEVLCEKVKVT